MRQKAILIGGLGFLALFASSGCAGIAPGKATLEQFMRIRSPIAGRLAPSGAFYYIDRNDGVYQLYRRPSGTGTGELLTTFADGIGSYTLSPDGRWIAVTAGVGGDEQLDIHLLNTTNHKLTPLLIDRATVFGSVVWNRDSTAFAYRANQLNKADFNIYVFDMKQRTSRIIWDRPGYWYPVDFTREGEKLVIGNYRSSSESYLWEIALNGEGFKSIVPRDQTWSHDGVGYAADENMFYAVSDYKTDRPVLQEIETLTGIIRQVLPAMADYEVDGATLNDERSVVAVRFNVDGLVKLNLYSIPDFKPLGGPSIPEGVIGGVDFQGDTLVYSVSNAQTPGVTYRWKLGAIDAPPTALSEADTQGIDVSKFSLPRLVRYQSFDGRHIPAFLYLPPDYQPGVPIPFIISYHGGPEGQFRPRFSEYLQYFVSRGYGILAPNVRGSSGYGTAYLKMDNYKNRMSSVRDGVAAAQWLIKNNYSAAGKIAAYGGSYGGFMTMAVITQAPELFGAACNYVGIVNFQTFLERTKSYRRKLREAEYGPLDDSEFLRSISPIYLVDRIKTPLFIAHGRNDPRVPLHEAEQLRDALRELGRDPEFLVFDDEGHGFRKEHNRIEFYGRLARFFDRHLRSTTDQVQ